MKTSETRLSIFQNSSLKSLLGWIAVFASAFCFYMSTVSIRWSRASVDLDPSFFVFARFLMGFGVACIVIKVRNIPLKPKYYHLLIGRTLFNCAAVFCFFKAVTVTSVAQANILNMTYPLFITIFSWVFFKNQRDLITVAMVFVSIIGVWLVLSPVSSGMHMDHMDQTWGLMSGIFAAAALIYLNISRQHHDTHTILFFMFGLGSAIMFVVSYNNIFLPNLLELFYLSLCAVFGITGQYLVTLGFRYVTAVEGSIISSTRILLAALLGPIMVSESALTTAGWMGAILIFTANGVLAARKTKTTLEKEGVRPKERSA